MTRQERADALRVAEAFGWTEMTTEQVKALARYAFLYLVARLRP
jgi:hypothetical protein